jgi:hypothetical protein
MLAKSTQKLQENIGRPSIFRILGAQQQEHIINPFLRAQHVTHKELNRVGRVIVIPPNHPKYIQWTSLNVLVSN